MSWTEIVHVIDDDAAIRDSLCLLLGSAGFVVRAYESAAGFLSAAPAPAGCVLTDVRMPDIDGLELQHRLREQNIHMPVIVMTGKADVPVAVRAMKAGAMDFLEKPFDEAKLLEAVRTALERSRQRVRAEADVAATASRIASMTPREREVLNLLSAGLSTKAIANKLGSSPRTVEVHRARVFEKLGARSLPELVRLVLSVERA